MKALILAAGYGTRLKQELESLRSENPAGYSRLKDSVEGRPKPLILVAGKPAIDYIMENLERAGIIEAVLVVNNSNFRKFEKWKDNRDGGISIRLVNDRTNSNQERLGAVRDLVLGLEELDVEDDTIVIAGDNLLRIELRELVDFFREKQTSVVAACKELDRERIRKSACLSTDENSLLVSFEEKPSEPSSEWICPAVYLFTADTIRLIKEMRFEHAEEHLGSLIMRLYSRIHIHALRKEESIRFDMGQAEDIKEADSVFRRKK